MTNSLPNHYQITAKSSPNHHPGSSPALIATCRPVIGRAGGEIRWGPTPRPYIVTSKKVDCTKTPGNHKKNTEIMQKFSLLARTIFCVFFWLINKKKFSLQKLDAVADFFCVFRCFVGYNWSPGAPWGSLWAPISIYLSLIHIWRCRRIERCRSRWSPYH